MSRAELLAAARALGPVGTYFTAAQTAAIRALGAASAAGFPAKKRGQPTGLTRGELYHRMLKSHVFDTDRAAWQSQWYGAPTENTFDKMKRTLDARKLAEKQAVAAT